MFDLSPERVREATVFLIALVLSIAVHEYGHAISADKLGDSTPRNQGRVTLNPLVHADPLGTLIFPLVAIFMSPGMLFGWGKPVMVNPMAFTRKLRMKTAHLIVAAAGPAMNVLLAITVTVLYTILLATGLLKHDSPLIGGIYQVIQLNWVLCFFNLIPCPPLDGGTILEGILPDRLQYIMDHLRQWGFMILIVLLMTGIIRVFVYPAQKMTLLSLYVAHAIAF